MPCRFFVSYRHVQPDEAVAQRLRDGLVRTGHQVFIDAKMKMGTDWVTEITQRIAWCDFLVLLLSEESMTSEMVQTEIRLAHRRHKRESKPVILPIRLRYTGPLDYELDSYLGRLQYVLWESDRDDERILGEVLEVASGMEVAARREEVASSPAGAPAEPLATAPSRPRPQVDPRTLSNPGGTVRLRDGFYLERKADLAVAPIACRQGETLVIKAARQMGKSSLLLRYLDACQREGKKVAFLDFSRFSSADFADYGTLLAEIAGFLADALEIEDSAPRPSTQSRLTAFVEGKILKAVPDPIVFAFDEVDRVLGRPYQDDFFTMLRLWHNQRAELRRGWQRVDLALVVSTEPYLLIDAGDRSPFNVTVPIELQPFSLPNCRELDSRYGSGLEAHQLDQLYGLLGGHPYLSRLAFYRLVAPDAIGFDELLDAAAQEDGPFGDHLRARLTKVCRKPELLAGMRQVIAHGTCADLDTYHRLHGAGLVRREGNRINPANLLYAKYFRAVL